MADSQAVQIDEQRNRIIGMSPDEAENAPTIVFSGKLNTVYIGSAAKLSGLQIQIKGTGNVVRIGDDCILNGRIVIKGAKQSVTIGDRTSFQAVTIYSNEGRSVEIGKDCMFSKRIEIRTTDSHSIIDRNTGKRINRPGDVKIGDRVWVGFDSVISKGITVPSNSIVGAKSFVNRTIKEEYVIIAGSPAKVVKRDVSWARELLPFDDDIDQIAPIDVVNLTRKKSWIAEKLGSLFPRKAA